MRHYNGSGGCRRFDQLHAILRSGYVKKRIIILVLIAIASCSVRGDQSRAASIMLLGAGSGGGNSCSNDLDFSQACNSQYFSLIFR